MQHWVPTTSDTRISISWNIILRGHYGGHLNLQNANLYRLLFVESNPIPVKWMLYKMGLIKEYIRLPLIELDETFHDEIMSELNKHRLI